MYLDTWQGSGILRTQTEPLEERTERLRNLIRSTDAILIGAGSGLSTSAGYVYTGARFRKYFGDFEAKYGFHDMYGGGFYPYGSGEEFWAFWSRYIWINRYAPMPKATYRTLRALVEGKDCFVLTTNVDHCFQRAGFDKQRLFYTQGDYGLWQSSDPKAPLTFDNETRVRAMVEAQGWTIAPDGALVGPVLPDGSTDFSRIERTIPSSLIPYSPDDGKPMVMNLRSDDTFVEDAGWHRAEERYEAFRAAHRHGPILYLELGVGMNTPVIIKFPFWHETARNPEAFYAAINRGEAYAPAEILPRSVLVDADIDPVLERLR